MTSASAGLAQQTHPGFQGDAPDTLNARVLRRSRPGAIGSTIL